LAGPPAGVATATGRITLAGDYADGMTVRKRDGSAAAAHGFRAHDVGERPDNRLVPVEADDDLAERQRPDADFAGGEGDPPAWPDHCLAIVVAAKVTQVGL
jgi:hypothetical protein